MVNNQRPTSIKSRKDIFYRKSRLTMQKYGDDEERNLRELSKNKAHRVMHKSMIPLRSDNNGRGFGYK